MIGILMRLSKEAERPLIVSIDIPSGIREGWLEGEPCVAADICLALEPLKRAHFLPVARSLCGRIIPVSDIFPQILLQADAGAVLLEESDLGALQPFLDPAVYKKRRGRLAIFAGSRGMAGAARLCACRRAPVSNWSARSFI